MPARPVLARQTGSLNTATGLQSEPVAESALAAETLNRAIFDEAGQDNLQVHRIISHDAIGRHADMVASFFDCLLNFRKRHGFLFAGGQGVDDQFVHRIRIAGHLMTSRAEVFVLAAQIVRDGQDGRDEVGVEAEGIVLSFHCALFLLFSEGLFMSFI